MKSTVSPYQTSATCVRIECLNGVTVRLAAYPYDLIMSNSTIYQSGSGYDVTEITASSNFSPSAIDLEGFVGFAGVTRDIIASGVFDGARAYVFACDFLSPVEDYEPLLMAILGKTTLEDDRYIIEQMSVVDVLNQSVGRVVGASCDKVFGGQGFAGCKKDLVALTVTGTLTAVSNGSAFTDSSRTEAADWFGLGTIVFTSGANAGLKAQEIKSFAGGVITTYEPFYYTPQIGDAYSMVPGCRKTLDACRDKYNNALNFGGFPFKPPTSVYASRGTN